ncbi:MAG: hypothetical protein HFH08_00255 [Bacilli bacterium]|nr:hypothetical protein [Bacilli bacterium]
MKILTIPSTKSEEILTDGVILGIQDLSVNLPFYIQVDDLNQYKNLKKEGKKIFIMLNKNMHNKDLEQLRKVMIELEQYSIDGVFYYDISVVNLKKELRVSYPIIWSQEHMTTNAGTCNFWASHGVEGAYLSSEITLEEIKEIRRNTDISLFVNIFGYLPMFDSKRHLVKNYLECFQLEKNGDLYYLEKEGNTYPIVDDKNGTTVYSAHILNAIKEVLELKNMGIEYAVLNSFLIEESVFNQVINLLQNLTEENKEQVENDVNELCKQNVDKGFLYTETIYKIKGEKE